MWSVPGDFYYADSTWLGINIAIACLWLFRSFTYLPSICYLGSLQIFPLFFALCNYLVYGFKDDSKKVRAKTKH